MVKADTIEGGMRLELWIVPMGFDATAEYLREALPINREFDRLDYQGEDSGITKDGYEYAKWDWDNSSGDNDRLITVMLDEKPDGQIAVGIGVSPKT